MAGKSQLARLLSSKDRDPEYWSVSKDDDDFDSTSSTPVIPVRRAKSQSLIMFAVPWFLTVLFGCSTLGMLLSLNKTRQVDLDAARKGTFATGYDTEFGPAREHMKVVTKGFTGAPSFDSKGKMYIPNPDPIRYVGDPRKYPEIDRNWERLVYGRYFRITKEEALEAWPFKDIEEFWDYQWGGYVTGLDMFHTLHCVNHLRKTFYPDIYTEYDDSKSVMMHQEHCIEQLRQYIMCSGDMTPIPTKYYKSLGRNYVLSDVPHTCRNFEKLQEWMMGRFHGPNSVPRENRTAPPEALKWDPSQIP